MNSTVDPDRNPTDLEEAPTDEEIERVARNVADDVKESKAQRPHKKRRAIWGTWLTAIVLLIVAAVLTYFNVAGIGPFERRLPEPTAQQQSDQLRLDLLAVLGYVDDFQEERGHLPATLEEMGLDDQDSVTYELVHETGFRITVIGGELRMTYDSTIDRETFFGEL